MTTHLELGRHKSAEVFGDRLNNGIGTPRHTLFENLRHHIFSGGPENVLGFVVCLANESDDRFLDPGQFRRALQTYLGDSDFHPDDASLDSLFESFLQYGSSRLSYDELVHAVKVEFTPMRKDVVRAAFRRLDHNCTGLVDFAYMTSRFNSGRHPMCGKVGDAASLLHEFEASLRDFLLFRRGRRVDYGGTNYVAWEEFEDFYFLINGCFDDDLFNQTLVRCWDLDKEVGRMSSLELEKTSGAPAAGIPPRSRVGLHHWQPNTLPASDTFRKADMELDHVFLRARDAVGRMGLRHAFNLVYFFVSVDDDVDDLVDQHEFRTAAKQSSIHFSDDEVEQIFKNLGKDITQPSGTTVRLLPVFPFLEALHGSMPERRRQVVEKAWRSFGEETVDPIVLRERFDAESHPLVARGQAEPQQILDEFLETLEMILNIVNGTKDNRVLFSGFAAYYRVVSSTIPPEKDAFFDVLVSRVWRLDGAAIDKHISPRSKSPMAHQRPPPSDGISAYAMDDKDFHRRYVNVRDPPRSVRDNFNSEPDPPTTVNYSTPITKSNILWDEPGLCDVVKRLSVNISRRGLKGWAMFITHLRKYDDRNNGEIHKQAFDRLLKTLGLGLAPEDRDDLVQRLQTGHGTLDYVSLISGAKGTMSAERQSLVMNLFHKLKRSSDAVFLEDLMANFDAEAYPTVVLGRKTLQDATLDFKEGLTVCAGDKPHLDICAFFDFFSLVNVVFPADDEFRLMTSSIFGRNSNSQ